MRTGFVILNYDSWEMTGRLAQKVASYDSIEFVVVVDNASKDGSFDRLKKMSSEKVCVVQSGKNGGYSFGNDHGAEICRQAGMEIIFFANPDVCVEEADIQKILDRFGDTDYAALSGVEYRRAGKMAQPPLRKRMGYWDDYGECFFLWRRSGRKKLGIGLDGSVQVQEAEVLRGSFFAIRMEDLTKIGGFDEDVFLYCEERILAKKLEDRGRKIGIVTDAGYIHTHSASIQNKYKKTGDQIRMLYASRLYYHKKYNGIKGIKYWSLLSAMKISILEYDIRDLIRMIKK